MKVVLSFRFAVVFAMAIIGSNPADAYYRFSEKHEFLFQDWGNSESCQTKHNPKLTEVMADLSAFPEAYYLDVAFGTEGFVLFRTKEDKRVKVYMIEYGAGFTELDLSSDLIIGFQGQPFKGLSKESQDSIVEALKSSLILQCNALNQS